MAWCETQNIKNEVCQDRNMITIWRTQHIKYSLKVLLKVGKSIIELLLITTSYLIGVEIISLNYEYDKN